MGAGCYTYRFEHDVAIDLEVGGGGLETAEASCNIR
jgi:hypothetical protein